MSRDKQLSSFLTDLVVALEGTFVFNVQPSIAYDIGYNHAAVVVFLSLCYLKAENGLRLRIAVGYGDTMQIKSLMTP